MSDCVRYPDCVVELVDTSANANAIISRVSRHLRNYLLNTLNKTRNETEDTIKEFTTEATSGSYDDVLVTCMRWVDLR